MTNSEDAVASGPTPQALVERLTRLLTVTPQSEDHFVGKRMPGGVGRVFGGEVIA